MAFRAADKAKNLTLKDFWKSYNTLAAIRNISDSWDQVKQMKLNGVWKKLCSQFMYDFYGFDVEAVTKNVVELSKLLDLRWRLMMSQSCWHLMEENYLLRTSFN